MELKDLTPELKDKVRECKTPDEIQALAKAEGYELSNEELKGIAGGNDWDEIWECPVEGTCGPVKCGNNAPFVP